MSMGIIVALLAGFFISVQGSLNGMVGNHSNVSAVISIPVAAQFAIYLSFIILNGRFRSEVFAITEYTNGVWYLVIAALLGIGIMFTLTVSFMKVGPLLALSIVVFSQLLVSMVIEHFGWFDNVVRTISLSRVAGLAFMLVGVLLFSRK